MRLIPVWLFFAALALRGGSAPLVLPTSIKVERELIITDLAVVEHSAETKNGGRFTLEFLLRGFSPDGKAKTALLDWLNSWTVTYDDKVLPIGGDLIAQWKQADHAAGLSDPAWQPRFANAPFRLLAIVNRLDLQKRDASGQPLSAGEGRFVFGVTDAQGKKQDATVIFEYEMPARTEAEVLAWAEAWHRLGRYTVMNADYCKELADLTERFTRRGALPGRPLDSALNQIRTNEKALSLRHVNSDARWNLQEFCLDKTTRRITATTTKQTPPTELAGSAQIAAYINSDADKIVKGRHEVPATHLGRQADLSDPDVVLWYPQAANGSALVSNPVARFRFALNTCNGCHGGETQTMFMHIASRAKGEPSILSRFLQDEPPRDAKTGQSYPKLKEITHRRSVLAAVLSQGPLPDNGLMEKAGTKGAAKPSATLLSLLASHGSRVH